MIHQECEWKRGEWVVVLFFEANVLMARMSELQKDLKNMDS